MNLNEQQLQIITQQLGRTPRGIITIAAQSANGIPMALQMRALVNDKPFPTLYWLCSKTLHKAIGKIETHGWVKTIEQRLEQDDDLREAFLKNQQEYVASRWQKMLPEDKQRIEELNFTELFHKYGIGGIMQWDKVRCLHMQYAHHLAEKNVIGELMDEEFQLNQLTILD